MTSLIPPLSAQEALSRYWNNSVPVNPVDIAKQLGIGVYSSASMEVDGAFLYHEGRPVIIYRPSGNTRRDRFTIAHELGHFCLRHGTSFRDPRQNFNVHNYNTHEVAANRFAAELLMPESVVSYAVRASNMSTVEEMSSYFDVSGAAMRIRLESLGFI